jgi:hypothetical protein
MAERRFQMKFVTLLVAICAFSQTAAAQTADCKSLQNPDARLACYDKSAPPVASAGKPVLRSVPPSKIDSGKYVDSIGAEDALMNARLKSICRGC